MFDASNRPYINGNPEFWTTGIKVEPDGKERYKCSYICECGHRGKRYIPLGTDHVTCHSCEYHNHVEPAGPIDLYGLPKRDRHGNFYTAISRRW